MYLYFNKEGVLKEIVNDKPLRQGSVNVDFIYAYFETEDGSIPTPEELEPRNLWISYKLPTGARVPSWTAEAEIQYPDDGEIAYEEIPHNPKRDLKFFKYYQKYPFYIIPLTFTNGSDVESALSENGVVSCTIRINENDSTLNTYGMVVFNVEDAVLGVSDGNIGTDLFTTVAQFQYLLARLGNYYSYDQMITYLGMYYYTKEQIDNFLALKADKVGPLPMYIVNGTDNVKDALYAQQGAWTENVIVLKISGKKFIGTFKFGAGPDFGFEFEEAGTDKRYYSSYINMANKTFNDIFSSTYEHDFELSENKKTTLSGANNTDYPTTKAVSDALSLKADKTYVDDLVASVKANSYVPVDYTVYTTLQDFLNNFPMDQREEGDIYLYPVDTSDLSKGYEQYIWEGSEWIHFGTTELDLSNYYTKAETRGEIEKIIIMPSSPTTFTGDTLTYLLNNPNARIAYGNVLYEKAFEDENEIRFISVYETSNTSGGYQELRQPIIVLMKGTGAALSGQLTKQFYNKSQADSLLALKADKETTYTITQVDEAIASAVSSVYKYKGTVSTYNDLPSSGLTVGDVYNVEDTGDNYAWTGTAWDKLAGNVDLSGYVEKINVPRYQTNVAILVNPLTNINGKVLETYSAELSEFGDRYVIKRNGQECSLNDAIEYINRMTGTTYVPRYNYDYPRNSYWVFSDGTLWKPQFEENDVDKLTLWKIPVPYALKSEVNTLLSGKQNTLVSGQNIKTINGQSILGSGDLPVSGGSGSPEWGDIGGNIAHQTDLQNELQDIRETAEGKTSSFVLDYDQSVGTYDEYSRFVNGELVPFANQQELTDWVSQHGTNLNDLFYDNRDVVLVSFIDYSHHDYFIFNAIPNLETKYVIVSIDDIFENNLFKVGDNVYVINLEVPDRWISQVSVIQNEFKIYFNKLETSKVDLTNYATKTEVNAKSDLTNVAPTYDSTLTYTIGEVVSYNGKIYKCTTAITTPESWDSTHWAETSVASDFVNLTGTQVITGVKTFSNGIKINTAKIDVQNTNIFYSIVNQQAYAMYSAAFVGIGGKNLGTNANKWKDLYLSGNLTDGTNSVTVADITKKPSTSYSLTDGGTITDSTLKGLIQNEQPIKLNGFTCYFSCDDGTNYQYVSTRYDSSANKNHINVITINKSTWVATFHTSDIAV